VPEWKYGYHQNVLIYLPQDLHTIFVYWDFTPARMQTLADFYQHVQPRMQLILRLCRQDGFGTEQQLPLAGLEPGGRYFYNLDPHAVYQVELGARSPEEEFVLFSRTPAFRIQPGQPVEPAGIRRLPPAELAPDWTIPPPGPQPSSNFNWS